MFSIFSFTPREPYANLGRYTIGFNFRNNIGTTLWDNGVRFPDMLQNPFESSAAVALANGGEVDFFDEVILDLSFINTKADCTYEKLKLRSNGFKSIINNFTNPNTASLDLKFIIKPLPLDNFGNETNGTTSVPNTNGLITITINETNLAKRTELGLARTLVHEAIHADMHRHLIDIFDRGINFDGLTSQELEALIESNRFPELFDAIEKYGLNYYQHEVMAQRYVGVIAEALKDYDNSSQTDTFYLDLSWRGLERTEAFRELENTEQDRIKQEWAKYDIIGNKNCE